MTASPRFSSRGFTVAELLIMIVVLGVVGAGLVQMLLSQSRFMDRQEASRSSRAVTRGSLNRLFAELRSVEVVSGVEAAAAGGKDFTLLVPYAWGIMCATAGGVSTLSLLPVDSLTYAAPGFSGFAWRKADGSYEYVQTSVSLAGVAAATCNAAGITTLPSINGSPAGSTVTVDGVLSTVPPVGTIFFLYRRVRYEFKASVMMPGRIGLWRTLVTPGTSEELAAPLDTTARVRFYVNNNATPQDAVPGSLASIRGLEFQLDGQSDRAPRGSSAPTTMSLNTSIFFTNRPD